MKTILILGAGRSSASLIKYLIKVTESQGWRLVVGDISEEAARQKTGGKGGFVSFDATDREKSTAAIAGSDVVISLLPAHLHPTVAKYCLQLKRHLITASYVSEEMKSLNEEARANDLLFLNECGLDPGIDHMSAMAIIDRIQDAGGHVISFESFTGGLIAPQTDPENPWRYKFTWNPRNVVMAGQGTAKFLLNGKLSYIPYQQLFRRLSHFDVKGYGTFEGYANRDSLKYVDTYGLNGLQTLLRGTLRYPGYCDAWDIFVQLGCCDDTYQMEGVGSMTHLDFIKSFLPQISSHSSVYDALRQTLNLKSEDAIKKLEWSGLFSHELIGLPAGTPAQILEHILNKRWRLNPEDVDLIVMQHRLVYEQNGQRRTLTASLTCKGEDSVFTAMAKTVGLPLGIATKLLLTDKINARGVVIPVASEFYRPILTELNELGIEMTEEEG